jgi:hypothetical protein
VAAVAGKESTPVERSKDALRERQQAFRKAFDGPAGELVLEDLARFCRAHDTTFHEDPRIHAVLEGRREVWLRIQRHLNLNDEQLWAYYSNPRSR